MKHYTTLILSAMFLVAMFSSSPVSAQERFNNTQISIVAGTMDVAQPSFVNLRGNDMTVNDYAAIFPWHLGFRAENENMMSEKFGLGWSLGGGIRHMNWQFTIPAGTPFVGATGLPLTEDWTVRLGFLGFDVDAGVYGAYHLSPIFEVYGGAGLAVSRFFQIKGKAWENNYYTENNPDESVGGVDGLSSTLFGAYGMAGVKLTFNEDYFVSLSARYTYGFNSDNKYEGAVTWDGPFYECQASAPWTSELMVLLGVGIMIER